MPRHTTSLSYQNIVGQPQDLDLPLSVHDLPPEIVGIIFTMLEETWLEPSDAGIPVLAVSRTCRRWRQISLSLPSLWSLIAIQLTELNPTDYHHIALITRLFADRSQKHPLHLNLFFDKVVSLDGREDTVIPILRTLVQHSERWHIVQLHSITRTVMLHPVFSPISGRLPMLTDLVLDYKDEEDTPSNIRCHLFSNCPSLTCLSWTPGYPAYRHQLPWQQIRVLDLCFMEISDPLRFAMSSTNISKLALYYCDGESSSPLPLSSITHYSIAAAVASEVYDPLKYLILPQLSSLDIARGPGYEDEDWEDCDEKPIRDFLKRSGCAVTSLSLRAVPISDEQLIKLLWSMPTLSSLRIEEFFNNQDVITNRTVTRRFLQELTIDDTSSPLLPKLTEIFLVLREDGLADTVLPNALISRWVPDGSPSEVACIKTVDIAFVDKSEQTIEDLTLKLRFLNKRRVWVNVQRVQVVATNEPGTQYELYH